MQFFIPGRPTTDSTTAAYDMYEQQGARGSSWSYSTTEAIAYLRAVAVIEAVLAEAAKAEQEAQERECCMVAVPTLQLLEQRRYDRAEGHRQYLQQVTKARRHMQRTPKFRKVGRRRIRT